MNKKVYYKVCLTQKAPLRIGNDVNGDHNSDLMLDGMGIPFIPGTSLAGVLRSFVPEDEAKVLFGESFSKEGDKSGHLIIGDAILEGCNPMDFKISKRLSISVNKWGTLNRGKLHAIEFTESNKSFYSLIEWNGTDGQYDYEIIKIFEPVLKSVIENGISIGAKTTRGYGEMSVSVQKKVFSFPEEIDAWLDFSPYDENAFEVAEELSGINKDDYVRIVAQISIDGNFAVFNPTSDREPTERGASPDKLPLKNMNGNPVITGSSWAGAFRHHIEKMCEKLGVIESVAQIDEMFGSFKGTRSLISFEETEILNGREVVITRNAVDRFTGGPKNMGVFTVETCYGGNGKMIISYKTGELSDIQERLLAMAIYDLHLGVLPIGGGSGTGRGKIAIDRITVNGTDKTEILNKILTKDCEVKVSELIEG